MGVQERGGSGAFLAKSQNSVMYFALISVETNIVALLYLNSPDTIVFYALSQYKYFASR